MLFLLSFSILLISPTKGLANPVPITLRGPLKQIPPGPLKITIHPNDLKSFFKEVLFSEGLLKLIKSFSFLVKKPSLYQITLPDILILKSQIANDSKNTPPSDPQLEEMTQKALFFLFRTNLTHSPQYFKVFKESFLAYARSLNNPTKIQLRNVFVKGMLNSLFSEDLSQSIQEFLESNFLFSKLTYSDCIDLSVRIMEFLYPEDSSSSYLVGSHPLLGPLKITHATYEDIIPFFGLLLIQPKHKDSRKFITHFTHNLLLKTDFSQNLFLYNIIMTALKKYLSTALSLEEQDELKISLAQELLDSGLLCENFKILLGDEKNYITLFENKIQVIPLTIDDFLLIYEDLRSHYSYSFLEPTLEAPSFIDSTLDEYLESLTIHSKESNSIEFIVSSLYNLIFYTDFPIHGDFSRLKRFLNRYLNDLSPTQKTLFNKFFIISMVKLNPKFIPFMDLENIDPNLTKLKIMKYVELFIHYKKSETNLHP